MTAQPDFFDICKNYHRGNEQSVAANKKVAKQKQRIQIIDLIKESWYGRNFGLTCEEIEDTICLSHQSCSARISELKRDGLIRKIGTRPTRSGCQAAVYQAV